MNNLVAIQEVKNAQSIREIRTKDIENVLKNLTDGYNTP